MKCKAILLIVTAGLFPAGPLAAAQYKPEFKMSINPSEETSWGRAANRFAAAIKYRTQGRIQITNYFDSRAGLPEARKQPSSNFCKRVGSTLP
jgi:TRAP-type C4-dicarboxylate transport system substrate-binding protein